jgi:hypothetical protein
MPPLGIFSFASDVNFDPLLPLANSECPLVNFASEVSSFAFLLVLGPLSASAVEDDVAVSHFCFFDFFAF